MNIKSLYERCPFPHRYSHEAQCIDARVVRRYLNEMASEGQRLSETDCDSERLVFVARYVALPGFEKLN